MSRKTTEEYITRKSEQYLGELPRRKGRVIDEVCSTTGLSRKYVINLLNGKIRYREHKGRGKTYDAKISELLKKIWREAGCPCAPYFKAAAEQWISEYSQTVALIKPADKELLLTMSDRTMSRLLAGEIRIKPGWSKANRHSGRNQTNEIKEHVPCASGEQIMACNVPPGDVQVDTFACGGGNAADNFFWILDGTDRKTQWTVITPVWNRAQHATLEGLNRIEKRFPFQILAMHPDNGSEVLNHHVMAHMGKKPKAPYFWRSRPRHSNDNAHVEEKNRSAGRALFGEYRLDRYDLANELIELCDIWSDFRNFFCPCKMLISKKKRSDGKGFRCIYDKPRTPFERVLEEGVLDERKRTELIARRNSLNGIELHHKVVKKLKRIKRLQEEYNRQKAKGRISGMGVPPPDSPLRGAPPGTSVRRPAHTRGSYISKDWNRYFQEKKLSTQFLANQKPPAFLAGTLPI